MVLSDSYRNDLARLKEKEAALRREANPVRPAQAAHASRFRSPRDVAVVPVGTLIEVRRIDDTGRSRRYLVHAKGETEEVGGWIGVNNLLSQTLDRE